MHCLEYGDHELFLNALGLDARKACEGFILTEGCWWVTVANVARWVTVNDQAVRRE